MTHGHKPSCVLIGFSRHIAAIVKELDKEHDAMEGSVREKTLYEIARAMGTLDLVADELNRLSDCAAAERPELVCGEPEQAEASAEGTN